MSNKNEKTDRNGIIFRERQKGVPVAELAARYSLSLPRIHRICLKEENKYLKEKVNDLECQLFKLGENKNGRSK